MPAICRLPIGRRAIALALVAAIAVVWAIWRRERPRGVAIRFIAAVNQHDDRRVISLLSHDTRDSAYRGMPVWASVLEGAPRWHGELRPTFGEATTEGDEATVPVSFHDGGSSGRDVFTVNFIVVRDGRWWRVDLRRTQASIWAAHRAGLATQRATDEGKG